MYKNTNNIKSRNNLGFTIVELLIVIVIIGILAAITIVSYIGISKKANEASLQSDLANNSKKLDMYHAQYDEYPNIDSGTGCPIAPSTPDNNYCLKFSNGNTFEYTYKTPSSYELKATKDTVTFSVSESKAPAVASALSCPTGFIVVPGSSTYGTSDFCVMKYEAKNVGGVATSVATGTPWIDINQPTATTTSAAACTGCHLITEAEWMTLAKNVLSVPENWSGGSVGNGYIYSGHNDNAPANAQVAAIDDNDGYYRTGQTTGSNQKRTLKLTNDEVIWDMAGNVWEWTSGQTASGSVSQPGVSGNAYSSWIEYPTLNVAGTLTVNVTPAGTGLSGASSWNSATNGIGQLLSNPAHTVMHGFFRGGGWSVGSHAGVLSLNLAFVPIDTGTNIGFRVSR